MNESVEKQTFYQYNSIARICEIRFHFLRGGDFIFREVSLEMYQKNEALLVILGSIGIEFSRAVLQ